MRLEATRTMLESIRTTQDNSNSFAPSVLSPRSFAEVASPTGTAEPSALPETSDSANNSSKALDDPSAETLGKNTVSYGTPDRPFGTRRRRSSMNDEPPPEFLCPITCELMADPVMVVTGQTYERSSIRQWISEGHRTCPITRMPLGNIELVPNYALRNAIRAWAQRRGIELKEPEFFPPPRLSGAQYKTANNASAPSQIPTWDNALPDRRSPPMLAVVQLFVGSPADKDAAVAQLATTASEDGENGRVSVVQAGAIPPLIMALLEGSDFAKETAARCIRFLSRSNNPIITQGCAAAIPALVRLLSVGSQAAKEAACGALVNLSAKTDVNKFQIAVAGGIPPLVLLLDFNQPNASRTSYECASAALCNLAFDNENRLKIAAAGAIPLLVQVAARSPTPEAGEYATHALGSLACEINENGETIVQAGAVPVLLAALQNGSPWCKEAAARTLRNLSFFENLREPLLTAGAIDVLTRVTESGTARAAESARAALNHLSRTTRSTQSSSGTQEPRQAATGTTRTAVPPVTSGAVTTNPANATNRFQVAPRRVESSRLFGRSNAARVHPEPSSEGSDASGQGGSSSRGATRVLTRPTASRDSSRSRS
ncbi:hypothetical protein CLOM_g24623 [Closterium sp. NIES-68]|nr:hypothetical protein CLOM_g24623 [Closterium sp. NIES-68]GJP62894.1 hypothetical protein CLOP_g19962 [Closterium sp. NIES-67]